MSAQRAQPAAHPPVIHVVAPAPFGGLEYVVQTLATRQLAAGSPVSAIALADDGPDAPLVEGLVAAGVPVSRVSCGRRYLRERRELSRIFRSRGPCIVHTHGYRPDVQAGAAAGRAGVPAVSTVHGFTGGDLKNRLYERLQERALRRFAAVVAVSRPLVDRLADARVPRERIQLVPNAYQPESSLLSRGDARAVLRLPDEPGLFVIGWVGRLSAEKGPDLLLEALARMREPRAHAALIGDGPDRAALEARAGVLGVTGRVHWPGPVARAARSFAAFDCLALSSRTEGTPIVLFEAMAARVPIVAAAVGGVPDVVSDGEALLVPPGDPGALAAALDRTATEPAEAAARASRAAARLGAERGVERWLAAYEAVYRSVFPLATPVP